MELFLSASGHLCYPDVYSSCGFEHEFKRDPRDFATSERNGEEGKKLHCQTI